MRVLVCGGRNFARMPPRGEETPERIKRYWEERQLLGRTLNAFHDSWGIATIIHGCAPGADSAAGNYAVSCEIEELRFPADWERNGKAAGPIRNQQMLDEGKPDHVIAFPGGTGTADMVARAKKAGVPVTVVEPLAASEQSPQEPPAS